MGKRELDPLVLPAKIGKVDPTVVASGLARLPHGDHLGQFLLGRRGQRSDDGRRERGLPGVVSRGQVAS